MFVSSQTVVLVTDDKFVPFSPTNRGQHWLRLTTALFLTTLMLVSIIIISDNTN